MMRKSLTVFKLVGVIVVTLSCLAVLSISIVYQIAKYEGKPYISYTRLMYVALGCDKYNEKFGTWPQSVAQLCSFETVPWTNDAWGREIIFVPYNESVGYGEVISYGRDGKLGGTGLDRELVVRFPTKANARWNEQQGKGLKTPFRQ